MRDTKIKALNNLPTVETLLKAICAKCLDCSGTTTEVERCTVKECALWQWRKEKASDK